MPPSWSNLAARRCMRDVKELCKMAAVELYRFEPERAPEENQAAD